MLGWATPMHIKAMVLYEKRKKNPECNVLLKEGPCRQQGLNSEPLGYNGPESVTLSIAPARHI